MMTLGWRWQRRRSNAGIVDVLWSVGLAASAVLEWGLRRRSRGAPGPGRGCWAASGARAWRCICGSGPQRTRRWALSRAARALGQRRQLKWFGLFQFQALLIPLFSIPFAAAAANPAIAHLWLAIAHRLLDRQRARGVARRPAARADFAPTRRIAAGPAARACGAIRATPITSSSGCTGSATWRSQSARPPSGWSLSGPVLMYVFLRWISGVPYTEAQALRTRGEDYREYQRSTSVLIPWWPRQA